MGLIEFDELHVQIQFSAVNSYIDRDTFTNHKTYTCQKHSSVIFSKIFLFLIFPTEAEKQRIVLLCEECILKTEQLFFTFYSYR